MEKATRMIVDELLLLKVKIYLPGEVKNFYNLTAHIIEEQTDIRRNLTVSGVDKIFYSEDRKHTVIESIEPKIKEQFIGMQSVITSRYFKPVVGAVFWHDSEIKEFYHNWYLRDYFNKKQQL